MKTSKPVIVLREGKRHIAIDTIAKILRKRSAPRKIFQRGGEMVRVTILAERHEDKLLRRPKGTVQLRPVSAAELADTFNRIARWKRNDKFIDCPPHIASTFLALPLKWRVPVLSGLTSTPILRADGTILAKAGYDSDTQLFLLLDGEWPSIPNRPTRADATQALEKLLSPFSEFPWVSEADKAVHVAAILTAIERRVIDFCPIFGYSAPAQRSGKSLLAESVAIIATGTTAPATAVSRDREEIRKMLASTLREGHLITNLDNVADGQPLFSPDLAAAITQRAYQDRLLGQSRMLKLPTNVLWTATGNNLSFRGDLASRALLCQIDARTERPEERRFHIANLPQYVKDMRCDLVIAALTMLRAYHVAGKPRQDVPNWGGFVQWSQAIREPLVWLGLADPCATRKNVVEEDPERMEAAAVLLALHEEFHDSTFTTAKILKHCNDNNKVFRVAMEGVSKGGDARALGNWLSRMRNRIVNGLRLVHEGKSSGAGRWCVRKMTGSPGSSGSVIRRYPRE